MNNIGRAEIWPLNTLTIPPYTSTNTVFYGEKKFIIIDPAPSDPDSQEILSRRIKERLALGHELMGLYLTHHHGDHIGAAVFLRDSFNAPIFAHPKSVEHGIFNINNFLQDKSIINLDQNIKLISMYSPGHANTHIVFYDPDHQVLVAGDMISDRGTILIPPQSGSLRIYLKSLEEIAKLDLKIVIPAHGEAICEKPKIFLENALKHRYKRIITTLEVLEQAQTSLHKSEITKAIYHQTISESLMFFAELSTESSLEWLLEAGLAECENKRWLHKQNLEAKEKLVSKQIYV